MSLSQHQAVMLQIIERAIREAGPMTTQEIARVTELPYASVRRCVANWHTHKDRKFWISGYDEAAIGCHRRPALYSVGKKEDVPYPHLGLAQKYKRHWQATKQKRALRELAGNPFGSLIAQVAK